MNESAFSIDGFDPLAVRDGDQQEAIALAFEDANRRSVSNILKSYTGYFDLFNEALQNALDAVEAKNRSKAEGYKPTIWMHIDMPASRIRVTDNGVGMSPEEFRFCLRPSVSFKQQADFRGHKGVGATFLAYGFSLMRLQSKRHGVEIAATLRQGRQWAEDQSNTVPRPRFEQESFKVAELQHEDSGTSVEILVGQAAGERPKNLGWIGAHSAEQWLGVLRIKTPLGGIYLRTPPFRPTVHLSVKGTDGKLTSLQSDRVEYFYPHEMPNIKSASISDIVKGLASTSGDAGNKFSKIAPELKRLDCVWDVWAKDDLLSEESFFESTLDEEDKLLADRHNVSLYACFLTSAKLWNNFNEDVLGLRKNTRLIHGGLQIASDYMPQGDLAVIPLTSTIGYQANSHVIVHFQDGNPDMGRKTFQPELTRLAEKLAVRSVNTMKKFLQHMRPDTGAQPFSPDRELHDWKKNQETYRDQYQLSYTANGRRLALLSKPQQEQDVVALFHELIGLGVLRGYRFFATSQHERYDSLYQMDYRLEDSPHYDKQANKLGVNPSFALPYLTEPRVLEYKYNFDSLVADFSNEVKYAKQINLVVCWEAGRDYRENFFFNSLLIGDEGCQRQAFGATHQAFQVGAHNQLAFEVLVLEDLLKWLQDPQGEEARQRRDYRAD